MPNNLIVLIAVGEPIWADFSLNLCLSIKANDPSQKVGLLYQESTIKQLQPLFDTYFDEGRCIDPKGMKGHELAFYLKTRLYDLATEMAPNYDNYLFIDSDCLLLPSPNNPVERWFEKLHGLDFTMYCNDVYDIKTKTRKRKDYTFWVDPAKCAEVYGLTDKLPQTNSSFIFFRKSEITAKLFESVKEVYDNPKVEFTDYKNAHPDEFAFNIGCALNNIYPHKTHYRPIWFQFASEIQNTSYVAHYYRAMGFAGVNKPFDYVVKHYNELSAYYRDHFGIVPQFQIDAASFAIKDPNPIILKPTAKKTLYRRGDVDGSEGGIFNPDQVVNEWDDIITIYRTEKNMDAYGNYSAGTAMPYVTDCGTEVKVKLRKENPHRIEDFRLFTYLENIYCNHKIVVNGKQGERDMKTALAHFDEIGRFDFIGTPNLPIQLQKCDINWVFFSERERLYCIYQLQPYQLFYSDDIEIWHKQDVVQPKLNWFHKNQFICNSTNPILVHGYYFMMFHSRESGVYHHGAVLINKDTKEIEYYTKNSIIIKDLSLIEGWNKTILYVSGAIYFEETDTLRILFGEGDSHACYHEYNATEFIQAIKDSYNSESVLTPIEISNQKALDMLKLI
jgi:hypothetical protein